MKKRIKKVIEFNQIEFDVEYSLYIEEVGEESVGFEEISIEFVRFNGRDITKFCEAFNLIEPIKEMI